MSEGEKSERGCYLAALRLLNRLPYLSHGLAKKLVQKEFPKEIVEITIKKLIEQEYLCDPEWVDAFVRGQIRKGKGPRLIRQKLRTRQVEEDLITNSLECHCGEGVQEERLLSLVESLREKRDFSEYKERQRAFKQLANKGFDPDKIAPLLFQ